MSTSSNQVELRGVVALLDPSEANAWLGTPEVAADPETLTAEALGVRVISAHGVTRRDGWPFDTNWLTMRINRAAEDDDCMATIVDVHSPGGEVDGIAALHRAVVAHAAVKPIIVYAQDCMASAAYWAFCGASRVFCGRTATVGSVGVRQGVNDLSESYKAAGIRLVEATSGDLKFGCEGSKVTAVQAANLARKVEVITAEFFADVQAARGVDKDSDVFRGGVYVGEDAFAAGLVDGIAGPDEMLAYAAALIQAASQA